MAQKLVNILVADGNEDWQKILKPRLRGMIPRCHVTSASDGIVAEATAAAIRFNLVVLELVLPQIDGFTLATHLRRQYTPAELPIIACTTQQDEEMHARAREAGCNEIIVKPVIDWIAFREKICSLIPCLSESAAA